MTKYFTTFHPEEANDIGYCDKIAYLAKTSSVVVVKDGKPFTLATFKRGYTSEKSRTIYANLWIHNPRNGGWHLHGYKALNGTASDAIFSCCKAFFDDANNTGAHYSVLFNLESIAEFFGFKNHVIVE